MITMTNDMAGRMTVADFESSQQRGGTYVVPPHIPTLNRQSIATSNLRERDWRWGVTGFDREIGLYVRRAGGSAFLPTLKNLSANKVARAILSPIQMADLQPAYALVA